MKNLVKSVLMLSVGLASCQKDNLVTPYVPEEVSTKTLREASPMLPKTYQLIKHGDAGLSYSNDGRLRKVTYGVHVRGGNPVYTQYTYNAQGVVGTLYSNGKIVQVITYLLDPATGRCYESKQLDYIPYGTNATVEKETGYLYVYNDKGQLWTRTNKKTVNEKTSFVYDTAGDLTRITNYGYSGATPGASVLSESTLYYDQPTGDPILADLSPVNCEAANLPDPYLKVFGKPSKHLVKLITEKFSTGGKYYNYTLNADGYVTTRQTYQLSGASLVETKSYDYLVTEIGFNL